MIDAHYYLFGYVVLHFAGLLGTIIAGYILSSLVADAAMRLAGHGVGTGQLGALLVISVTFIASLGLGVALFFLEVTFAADNYGELLEAFLHNHWLASIPPAFAALCRHRYFEQWLDNIFGARTTS